MNDLPRPKDITNAQAVELLRQHAADIAFALEAEHADPRKIRRKCHEASLNAVCTSIEILTENGNYYPERLAAFEEARRRTAARQCGQEKTRG